MKMPYPWNWFPFEIEENGNNLSLRRVTEGRKRLLWRAEASAGGKRWIVYAEDPITALLELEEQTYQALETSL